MGGGAAGPEVQGLRKVQESLAERTDEFCAPRVSLETEPIMESLATDVMNALSVGDFAVSRAEHVFHESRVDFGNLNTMMRYMGRSSHLIPRPIGVVGIIAPWNYPLAIPYSQTMMCLAAGNGVVLKPSSHTPLTAMRMMELLAAADLPKGLVQLAIGSGREVGEALASSDVDRIIFTGHAGVGRRIMQLAAQRLTPITLELGGKDALLVLGDADLDGRPRPPAGGVRQLRGRPARRSSASTSRRGWPGGSPSSS